ncbi:MAG: hypothetical protein RLZZ427_1367 [Pseudomonadota bacterium]|jgi:iron complex outermembrane receptor protein
MTARINVRRDLLCASAFALAAMAAPQAAYAQTVDSANKDAAAKNDDNKEIVVTGTIIRGAAPVGSSIISVTATDIQKTGLLTTTDILKSIPQVSGIGTGEATTGSSAQNANLNISRANALNIRGLGLQATLTLLNGRRLPVGGFGGQLFDPNSIPAIALSRIDVVADGASATYGSDAVAGVANLVLRTDVEGLEARARYGAADDYNTKTISAVAGHKWDTGRIMVAAEYGRNDQLLQSDRARFFTCDQTGVGGTNNCTSGGAPGNLVFGSTVYGLPGGSGVGVTQAQLLPTANRLQASAYTTVIPANDRLNVLASARQELNDSLSVWTEGFYYERIGHFYTGSPTISSLTVPSTNPNFIRVTGQSMTSETVQYSLYGDYGDGRPARSYEQGTQVATGFDLKLGENWNLSAAYTYNHNFSEVNRTGELNTAQLALAVKCTVAGFCLNPFGSGGSADNVAALQRIMGYTNFRIWYTSHITSAKIDGTLASLPGGDIKLAIGGQYLKEKLHAHNESNAGSGPVDLNDVRVTADFGKHRTVKSAFAEVIVPLVGAGNAMPGVQSLELNVAGRYDEYSDFGHTTNPKLGIKWAPVPGVVLRGSYGKSFRAPTLSDSDPYSTPSLSYSNTIAGSGRNVFTMLGGNADVGPEKATTWSLGLELKPELVSGFNASFNYFHIAYRDVIDTPGNSGAVFSDPALASYLLATNVTAAQYNAIIQPKLDSGLFRLPSNFTPVINTAANTTNLYAIVDGRKNNTGVIKMNGLDFQLSYQFPAANFDWLVGLSGTRVFNYKVAVAPGSAVVERVNNVNFPLKFRARGQVGLRSGGLSLNTFYNYTNSYRAVGLLANNLFSPAIVAPAIQDEKVSANVTVDATVTYAFAQDNGPLRDLSLSLSAQNLFNRAPPFARVSSSQVFDSANASVLGRMVSLELRKKF